MKSFSDKTEIRKSKLFDRVTLENESKINKRVGSNKNMYAGKKCQKLKRVYMFIRYTRVGRSFYNKAARPVLMKLLRIH